MVKKVNKSRSVSSQKLLLERLKDHDYAVAYLNAALEEGYKSGDHSHGAFLAALRNVAQAHGPMSELAKRARVRRESLYRMLSKNGNPALRSFTSLLHAMDLHISFR